MKTFGLSVLILSACAVNAYAQTSETYSVTVPLSSGQHGLAVIDVSDLFEPGLTDTANKVFGYPGRRMGSTSASEPRSLTIDGLDRDARNHRAWGLSVGFETGPVTIRVAHQNKNVARIVPA